MGKDCGRGNEPPTVYHDAEWEGRGPKIPPESPACVSLSKSRESKKTDL